MYMQKKWSGGWWKHTLPLHTDKLQVRFNVDIKLVRKWCKHIKWVNSFLFNNAVMYVEGCKYSGRFYHYTFHNSLEPWKDFEWSEYKKGLNPSL